MKRKTKTVEKRTYSLKGAIPRFVSLVSRGANFTPLTQLRYDETDKFGQEVEINRIEFSKTTFATQAQVESYLVDNAYESFTVAETEDIWVVLGQEDEKFEDIQPIEYEDGVRYFVGKLKDGEETEAPAAEVIGSEEFSQEEKTEEVAEISEETSEEIVQESQEEVEKTNEETQSEETNTSGEESQEGFSAEKTDEEEVTTTEVETETHKYSDEDYDALAAKYDALEAKFAELEEKLNKFTENTEETIDETPIVIQNSQAVITDEIVKEEEIKKDEKAEKFSQARKNDLFGLRG